MKVQQLRSNDDALRLRNRDQKKNNVTKFFVSEEVLPQTISLLYTRAIPLGIELVIGNHQSFDFSTDFYGALIQYPGKYGQVYDYASFTAKAKNNEIKVAVAADILSLVLLEAPGKWGADVVVGTTQRFGIPLGYGGPHAAFFATKDEYKRNIPGRIIGVTRDTDSNRALRMALQTREQHIKRDKATSKHLYGLKFYLRLWLECMQYSMVLKDLHTLHKKYITVPQHLRPN